MNEKEIVTKEATRKGFALLFEILQKGISENAKRVRLSDSADYWETKRIVNKKKALERGL